MKSSSKGTQQVLIRVADAPGKVGDPSERCSTIELQSCVISIETAEATTSELQFAASPSHCQGETSEFACRWLERLKS